MHHNRIEHQAIGIDVGGSSLKCGLVTGSGEIVHALTLSLQEAKTEAAVVQLIENGIAECAGAAHLPVAGIGIGFPGIIEDGVVIGGAVNLPGFDNFPLATILSKSSNIPVWIDNDANMMALGECAYGGARDCDDVIFLTVGTGIGGAVLVNKKIVGGYRNRGGEIGHMILHKDGKPCGCGANGCFEAYASTRALLEQYQSSSADNAPVSGEMIVQKFLEAETIAVNVMEQHFDYMATGIASLVNIFSPQRVIIGGGISEAGDFYIGRIAERVKAIAIPVAHEFTQIVPALLGNKAGLLGSASKVFEKMIPKC